MNQRWWLLIERAQAVVPLLAVAALAGFTWWLVQSSPKEGGDARPPVASSAPDYQLQKARIVRFDAQGRLQAILDGTAMRHYPDPDRLVIDQLALSARDETGQGLRALAREGQADRKAELVHLRGDVRVVALPPAPVLALAEGEATGAAPARGGPLYFTGEGLRIDTRQRIVSSDQPVRLLQDHSRVDAQSVVYNDQTRIAEFGGRVQGRYAGGPGTAHITGDKGQP